MIIWLLIFCSDDLGIGFWLVGSKFVGDTENCYIMYVKMLADGLPKIMFATVLVQRVTRSKYYKHDSQILFNEMSMYVIWIRVWH